MTIVSDNIQSGDMVGFLAGEAWRSVREWRSRWG